MISETELNSSENRSVIFGEKSSLGDHHDNAEEPVSKALVDTYLPAYYLGDDSNLEAYWEYGVVKAISLVIVPMLNAVGLVSNCLSVTVLVCGKLPKSTTFTYMAGLAICDAVSEIMNLIFHFRLEFHAACGLPFFFFYFSIHGSVLLTVAMTAERYLMIKYPLKANSLFTITRARIAMCVIALVSFLLNIHNVLTRGMAWTDYLQKHICVAVGKNSEYFLQKVWPWLDGSVYCYLPFTALLVMNILILTQIKQSNRFFFERNSQCTRSFDKRSKESRQITVMLFLVTLAFLLLVGPMGVLLVVTQNFLKTDSYLAKARLNLVQTIFNCFTYINHASNFFLYFISGRQFRKEVFRLFCRTDSKSRRVVVKELL